MKACDLESLRRAVQTLEGDDRLMLVLSRLEGLSSAEVARVLGCSEQAAERNLQRAEARLCRSLSDTGHSYRDDDPIWRT